MHRELGRCSGCGLEVAGGTDGCQDVRDATGPEAHAEAVERWARSTWQAYAPLHDLARDWLSRARSA